MYYYGASIQGIQGFIFATNNLQEIVGASEIIKKIEKDFKDTITKKHSAKLVMSAAGNMKAIFYNKDDLQEFIKSFSKNVIKKAYGITISEAVVKIEGKEPNQKERNKLEEYLKIQRNRPQIPIDLSLNITKLAPSSAKPIVKYSKKNEPLDKSALQKREQYTKWFEEKRKEYPKLQEYKEIRVLSNKKGKIAVIHIDGNGLGALIQKKSKNKNFDISIFSKNLEDATKEAFKASIKNEYKLREVILGGDDVTVICDADIALEFTKNFLKNFEEKTKEKLGENGLTACAGIAYCNEKFPFHYAVDLAEELTKIAKKDAKKIDNDLAPSCLMFHNIQSSAFKDWEDIVKRELTIKDIRFDFGPYYLNQKDKPKIEDFINLVNAFKNEKVPISKFRDYLTKLHKNKELAQEWLKRIDEILDKKVKMALENGLERLNSNLTIQNIVINQKTPLYDILQIVSNTKG